MKKESKIVKTFMIHFLDLIYGKMKKKFHVSPEIEEVLESARVEFPLSNIRNYSTIRNRLTRLSKDVHVDDLSTLTKMISAEYKADEILDIHNKIESEYDLDQTSTDLEKEKDEAMMIMLGKR